MTYGLDAVSVHVGTRRSLDAVSFTVAPATITVLVGGDGAGKSTALSALVGLVRADEGTVRRPPKSQIGYVPATAGLYDDLTVDENIDFVARAFRIPASERATRASRLLERVGLSSARERLGSQLSGGMKRKLALVMALVARPQLLVLDEPTTGIDPLSRVDMWRLLSAMAADGLAIAVATTYVNEAARGTTTVLLDEGRVLASGTPEDILAAVPGGVGTCAERPSGTEHVWRRGAAWRVWAPSGELPPSCQAVEPDMEDAVIVAELARGAGS